MIREFASAKINLFLHVGQRRADGFHSLQSLVVFANVGDTLTFEEAGALSLEVDGPFASALIPGDNIVLRAARALADGAGINPGAKIVLTKNLPVASGVGGGSADGAATLRGLQRLWRRAKEETRELAESLGSDVPVCMASSPAWMEGRGERLSAIPPLPSFHLVLANPGIALPTASVFGLLEVRHGVGRVKPRQWRTLDDLLIDLRSTGNDLEAPASKIAPSISVVLKAISRHGAELTRMSGSGATCFGLFRRNDEAAAAASALKREEPTWWIAKAGLGALETDEDTSASGVAH